MKTARFACRGEAHFYPFSPIYTCDLDSPMADKVARGSGDYVPLAEAERLASRVAALEAALRGLIGWCEATDADASVFVADAIKVGEAALEPTERTIP